MNPDRLARAANACPQDEPAELRRYLAGRELCATEKSAVLESGKGLQVTSAFFCDGMPRRREELQPKFPQEPRLPEPAGSP